MLEKIDFYPGQLQRAVRPRDGRHRRRRRPRDPRRTEVHGLAQVDLIDARVLVEGPIAGKGWNFTRRRTSDVRRPLAEARARAAGAGVTTAPVYYDYQVMLQKDFDKKNSLRFFFFGSDDRLEILIADRQRRRSRRSAATSRSHTGVLSLPGALPRTSSATTPSCASPRRSARTSIDFGIGDNFFVLDVVPDQPRAPSSRRRSRRGVTQQRRARRPLHPVLDRRAPSAAAAPGRAAARAASGARPPLDDQRHDAIYRPALYDEVELTPWARHAHRARRSPRLREGHARVGRRSRASSSRQDLHRELPAHHAEGRRRRLRAAAAAARDQRRLRHAGARLELARPLRRRRRARAHAADRGVARGLLQGSSIASSSQGARQRRRPGARSASRRSFATSRTRASSAGSRTRSRAACGRTRRTSPEQLFNFDQTHILTVLGSYRLGRGWEFGARFRLVSGSLYHAADVRLLRRDTSARTSRSPAFRRLAAQPGVPPARHPRRQELAARRVKLSAYLDIRTSTTRRTSRASATTTTSTLSTNAIGHTVLAQHRHPRGALR